MNYDEMVKMAYEDVIGGFEKEAKTLKSPLGPAIKQSLEIGKDKNRVIDAIGKMNDKMFNVGQGARFEALKNTRDNLVNVNRGLTNKAFNLQETPAYKSEMANVQRFHNSVGFARPKTASFDYDEMVKMAYEDIVGRFE